MILYNNNTITKNGHDFYHDICWKKVTKTNLFENSNDQPEEILYDVQIWEFIYNLMHSGFYEYMIEVYFVMI